MTTSANQRTQRRPNELDLSDSHPDVVAYATKRADHPHLRSALQASLAALRRPTGPSVITIAGPSGAGKTTLARKIYVALRTHYQPEAERDRGRIPVAGVCAVPPTGRAFSWKDLCIRLLTNHGEVMLDRKLALPQQCELLSGSASSPYLDRSNTDHLRRTLEECLRQRRTRVLIIDEAHHLLMVKDPALLEFQFESIKSLTIETQTTIILAGTYDLLSIRDLSGQLVRRSEIIHLPRYDARKDLDKRHFDVLLRTFINDLPIKLDMYLDGDARLYFYVKSGGSVGVLKDWLVRCLDDVYRNGRNRIRHEDLERFSLPNKALHTMIDEAMAGELKLEDESTESIRDLLFSDKHLRAVASNRPGTRSVPVGKRSPIRDVTGGMRYGNAA